jgi:(2Fe-2S) ferredoxin
MIATGLTIITAGIAIANRYYRSAGENDSASSDLVPTRENAAVDEDALLDNVLEGVFVSDTLKYVHSFYDVDREYSAECECEYGFSRKDFKKGEIAGRITYHDKHVFVLTKLKATEWGKDFGKHGFGSKLKTALKKRLADVNIKCNVSFSEAADGEDAGDEFHGVYSILVLPDMVKYLGVTEDDLDQLVDSIGNKPVSGAKFKKEKFNETQIFVCCHKAKDMRCGVCGPRIFKAFVDKIPKSAFKDQPVTIRRVNHLGGHKYAANIIIYQYNPSNNKVFGDWYGYVDINDIDRLIDQHLVHHRIVKDIWRGRAGMKPDFCEKFLQFQ